MTDPDEPSLGLRIELTREAYYTVIGNLDALQSLATELSRAVAEYPHRDNPLGINSVCSFPVLRSDGRHQETYLSFEVASDLAELYAARTGWRGFLAEWGGCLRLLLFGTLSAIGLWTLMSWIF